jgi:single-stranded-DNA-specific exonuclease
MAVDCGTSSPSEIAGLQAGGVDTIVLDHHETTGELPECVALVNPKRSDGEPLASVGVAFKLAHALLKSNRHWQVDLREHLDLVALGTVADVVPLTGENRILVKAGLERLARTDKTGLRALMEVADVGEKVKPHHIGFRLGPRLNAAGRLADAMAALELLLTDDAGQAAELAKLLHEHNAERQRIEAKIVEAALEQASQCAGDRVLVLADEGWHVGVIGIVASRVLQEFYRPTVVIGAGGKGSCRSINGFSMVAALEECAPLLERFGGHEMAAGLSVQAGNVEALRRALNEVAARTLTEECLVPPVMVDAVARLAELDAEFFAGLEKFEPCGTENPTPVFAARNVVARSAPRVVGGKHLKFSVTDGEMTMPAIWFGAGDVVLPSGAMDVAFMAELDEFRGEPTVQLRVRDVRCSIADEQ